GPAEIADLGGGGVVQVLEDGHHQVHGAIKVAALDHAVVGVGVAGGDDQIHRRHAAVALLNHRRVVAVSTHQIGLQRDARLPGHSFDPGHQLAVGELAGIPEEKSRAAAQPLLGGFGADAGDVAGDARLERNANVGFDDLGGGGRAAFADLLLHGGGVEDLIGVGRLRQTPGNLDHDRAADAIVPGFADITLVG